MPRPERATPGDLVVLASDTGPAPMNIAAVLVLEEAEGLDLATLTAVLGPRVARVARLRQRLVRPPLLCGRPVWQDDPGFTLEAHLSHTEVSQGDSGQAGDREALLGAAADAVCRHLPHDRPLWSALLVTGLEGHRAALVLVLHHVVADGIGGLAVLAELADSPARDPAGHRSRDPADGQGPEVESVGFPRPPATPRTLAADALRERFAATGRLWPGLRGVMGGLRELGVGAGRPVLAGPTSLNRPTGAHRRLTTVTVDREQLVAAAHRRSCTVNDLLLTAVSGCLGRALRRRGERLRTLIVSVPVAPGPEAGPTGPGNRTGVRPIAIRLDPEPAVRLREVAAWSRQWRTAPRAQSAAPLSLAFRGLRRIGLLAPLLARQRLVHTFVSNVRGPTQPLALAGLRVVEAIPVAVSPGNVGASFDALSYANHLVVTVVADPTVVPEQDQLTEDLRSELLALLA
jgi:diacylglycerol O-acyltransferase / wax synthase